MINNKEIKIFFLKHGYLLIAAAWLITIAFLINNYWLYYSSPKGVQHSLEQNIQHREKRFYQFINDSVQVNKLLNRDYDKETLDQLTGPNQDFYLFFFKGNWQTFWTTDQIAFNNDITRLPEGSNFVKLQNGYYEVIRKNLSVGDEGENFVLGFIPIKEEYYFTNPYLPNRYYQLPRISNQYVINTSGSGLPITNINGDELFSIQYKQSSGNTAPSWVSGILFALALICILIFVDLLIVYIGNKTNKWIGFILLACFIFIIRYLSYIYQFPFSYNNFKLFDPTIYASNLILRSLGDLLIDVALAGWLISYFRNQLYKQIKIKNQSNIGQYGAMFALSFITYYASLLVSEIIRGLVINSKISFDVTDFFSLNIYSIVGFSILGLLAYCFFLFSLIINDLLEQLCENNRNLKYMVFGITGIIWLLVQLFFHSNGNIVALMIWCIFYFYLLDAGKQSLGRKLSLPQFILWLLIMTLSITALLVHYNNQREIGGRRQLAIKLSKQKDPTLEFNLGIQDTAIIQDSRVLGYYRNPVNKGGDNLFKYLIGNYFANLQNKYDFQFYSYNDNGSVIGFKDTSGNKNALDIILQHNSEPTSVPNLYYHEVSFSDFSYIARLSIKEPLTDSTLGYLYYELKPKAIKQETLYPKLLMKNEDNQFQSSLNKYSYAVYDKLKLVYNRNDYPFPLHLSMKNVPLNEYKSSNDNGYSLLWYKPTPDKLVVVAKPNRMLLEAITLFAYMFCIFLLLILIFRLVRFLVRARMRPKAIMGIFNMTIRVRVHAIIIFIVVFVFIILGVSTISFFIRRYDTEHREELSNGMNILLTTVQRSVNQIAPAGIDQGFLDPSIQSRLKKSVQDIADTHNVDINIYDLNGTLLISTQNLIYENGLLASKIDPSAYYKLLYLHQVQVIQKEQVGNLQFLSSYASIRDKDGQTVAFLNQPYFASQVDLKQEISNFLVTLLILNAFILLLSGMLALLLTSSITRSFSLIMEKLRKVNLSGANEEIYWKRDDEIGQLVKEYNKMVHKLEESATALAKSEREGAWREMARQIAHEIKNPLTPMKLSLQHLQRAIDQDSPKAYKLTQSVATTLIEQIEHLSQIASDFSAFANIPYANSEVLLLNEVLRSVILLHNGYDQVNVIYDDPATDLYVYADKTQLNRLFTNLVQNAMQAIPPGNTGRVDIATTQDDDYVTIMIKDNGGGIPENVKKFIFTPNFTTKSSGTGLGLAMSKNIVEQMQGDIWFESEENEGATFYVKFKLLKKDTNGNHIPANQINNNSQQKTG